MDGNGSYVSGLEECVEREGRVWNFEEKRYLRVR